jgi:hypothetical protein
MGNPRYFKYHSLISLFAFLLIASSSPELIIWTLSDVFRPFVRHCTIVQKAYIYAALFSHSLQIFSKYSFYDQLFVHIISVFL